MLVAQKPKIQSQIMFAFLPPIPWEITPGGICGGEMEVGSLFSIDSLKEEDHFQRGPESIQMKKFCRIRFPLGDMDSFRTLCTGAVFVAATEGPLASWHWQPGCCHLDHLEEVGCWAGRQGCCCWCVAENPGHSSWCHLFDGAQKEMAMVVIWLRTKFSSPIPYKDSDSEGAPLHQAYARPVAVTNTPGDNLRTDKEATTSHPFTCPLQTQPQLLFLAQD